MTRHPHLTVSSLFTEVFPIRNSSPSSRFNYFSLLHQWCRTRRRMSRVATNGVKDDPKVERPRTQSITKQGSLSQ